MQHLYTVTPVDNEPPRPSARFAMPAPRRGRERSRLLGHLIALFCIYILSYLLVVAVWAALALAGAI